MASIKLSIRRNCTAQHTRAQTHTDDHEKGRARAHAHAHEREKGRQQVTVVMTTE